MLAEARRNLSAQDRSVAQQFDARSFGATDSYSDGDGDDGYGDGDGGDGDGDDMRCVRRRV